MAYKSFLYVNGKVCNNKLNLNSNKLITKIKLLFAKENFINKLNLTCTVKEKMFQYSLNQN